MTRHRLPAGPGKPGAYPAPAPPYPNRRRDSVNMSQKSDANSKKGHYEKENVPPGNKSQAEMRIYKDRFRNPAERSERPKRKRMKYETRFKVGQKVCVNVTGWKYYQKTGTVIALKKPHSIEYGTLAAPLVPVVRLDETGEELTMKDSYLSEIE